MSHTAEKKKTHRDFEKEQVVGSIGQICDAWPDAQLATEAIGFPTGQGGRSGKGGHADPTANRAMTPDIAIDWMRRARVVLLLILRVSSAPGRAWVGPFDPKAMRGALKEAGGELVELRPMNVGRMFNQLYDLADQALREWPPTPVAGMKIDDVVVGEKAPTWEMCGECRSEIWGGTTDPVRRLDGKPFHKTPCYETVRKRRQRSGLQAAS